MLLFVVVCCANAVDTINPVRRTTVSARRLLLDGDTLYVGGTSRVTIYNVLDRADPQQLGFFSVPEPVRGMALLGTRLVVGLGQYPDANFEGGGTAEDNVRVQDVANPASTTALWTGHIGDADLAADVVQALQDAVLFSTGHSLLSVTLSQAGEPTVIDSLAYGSRLQDVVLQGDTAWIGAYAAIEVADVGTPADLLDLPQRRKAFAFGEGQAFGIAREGDLLVTAQRTSGVKLYDISNPSGTPQSAGPAVVLEDFNEPVAVAVQNGYVYAGAARTPYDISNGNLRIIDARTPATAAEVLWNLDKTTAYDVLANGEYVYVAEDATLAVFRHTAPEVLQLNYGWNDISIRAVPTDNSVAAILGSNITGGALVWDPGARGAYMQTDSLTPYTGHWVYCHVEGGAVIMLNELAYPGDPDSDGDGYTDQQEADAGTNPQKYEITLQPGWNDVSLGPLPPDASAASVFGAHIATLPWVWEGYRYRQVADLTSYRGHLVYCTSATPVVIEVQMSR